MNNLISIILTIFIVIFVLASSFYFILGYLEHKQNKITNEKLRSKNGK